MDAPTFAERMPLPRDYWHVAVASLRLTQDPLPTEVFEHRIVLFRQEGGGVAALQDRCPHRGVALSLGGVEDGQIACAYHGWRFGADGRCAHIPSLLDGQGIPGGVGVRGFPCLERDGYVWVWMGEGDPAPAAPPPIAGFAEASWVQGALDLACEAILPIENNLDLCHPYFTHVRTHGLWFDIQANGFREKTYDLSVTDTGLAVSSGWGSLVFDLPSRATVSFNGPAGTQAIVLHHTPTGPRRCRQDWLVSTPAEPGAAPSVRWSDAPSVIFEQDRRVLESAQLAYDREGDAFERSVEADAPTLLVRRIIAAAAAGRWPQDRARMGKGRTVRVRS
jgi:phenylpropionate dioxygenase-like ring-hydroxylating dioxygenase large terminal subunit